MFHHTSGDNNPQRRVSDPGRVSLPDFVDDVLSGSELTFHHHVLPKRQIQAASADQDTSSQLSALNFVRLAIWKDWGTKREISSLREVLSKETAEEAVLVCNYWMSNYSTDFEEILRVPLFFLSLNLRGTQFGRPDSEGFRSLLTELDTLRSPACLIIVRNSEAVACVKLRVLNRRIFVVFSTDLQNYPNSVHITVDASLTRAVRRLVALFPAIRVSDARLKGQAELISRFTAYMFVQRMEGVGSATLTDALLKSSLTLLSLREEAAYLRSRSSTLTGDTKRLQAKLKERKKHYEEQRRTIEIFESWDTRVAVTPQRPALRSYTPPAFRSRSAFGERPKVDDPTLKFVFSERDDLEYAISLQLQFDEENLVLSAERDLVTQDAERTFVCNMCYRDHSYDAAMLMNPCEHTFCPACLRTHVVWELNERHFPVQCPACRLNPVHERGLGVVTSAMVLELGVTDDEYDVWVELEMAPMSVVLYCRKCGHSAFVDREDVEERPVLLCPVGNCDNVWCKLCQTTIVVGGPEHSCEYWTGPIDHFADLKALRERLRGERTQNEQWHARLSGGAVSTIADLQRVTGELSNDAAHTSTQTDGFAIVVPNFREALVRTIRVSADAAISSVVGLGDSLLQLSVGRTTVARTRGLALRAQREFRTVHERAREALVLATDLGVEITYWRTRAESCSRGVRECRVLAGEFARGAEVQVAQAQERIAAALADCERATQTYNSAEDRKRSNRRARRIRNIFTLGIGALFDIGGLDRAVEAAEQVMRTAQANRGAAEGRRDGSRADLDARHAEQRAIEDVSARLEALGPALALAERALDEHRARLTDGANAALDVGVFFGGLVARTAAWDVIMSAPALAAAVVKLQRLLDANTHLTGVFITSPTVLNDELMRLADSNVPPDELSALM
ncbi:hypothetical protein EDB84DRAFT_1437400 [Lactarius hengduanensis]|nr:hypothetical protein EDB84DRAFT_1437400 [Lactarius hengduanensis]